MCSCHCSFLTLIAYARIMPYCPLKAVSYILYRCLFPWSPSASCSHTKRGEYISWKHFALRHSVCCFVSLKHCSSISGPQDSFLLRICFLSDLVTDWLLHLNNIFQQNFFFMITQFCRLFGFSYSITFCRPLLNRKKNNVIYKSKQTKHYMLTNAFTQLVVCKYSLTFLWWSLIVRTLIREKSRISLRTDG